MNQRINLLIFDCNLLFGECLSSVLSNQRDFSSVELATDFSDVSRLEYLQPCIVLISMNLSEYTALELTRQIRSEFSTVKIIVIGMTADEDRVMKCIEAGANGYTLERDSFSKLLDTIYSVNRGETICSPRVAYYGFSRLAELTRERRGQEAFESANLTPREIEILQLIVEGLSNKQIAQRLIISLCTVKNHVHNILEKLGVQNRAKAAHYAMCSGIRRTSVIGLNHS